MYFQQESTGGALELADALEISDEAKIPLTVVVSLKLGGNVKWSSPLVRVPSKEGVRWFGQYLKHPEQLTYAPVIELQYLGEMAEFDNANLQQHLSLHKMELVFGCGIKNASDLNC